MKEDYQEALKKLTLFFLPNPVPFNKQIYQKQRGPGTSDQSLFRLQNKFRKNCFISYKLSDQVWWYNIEAFKLFQKLHLQIYARQFMASYIIRLPLVVLSLKSVDSKEKKYKKLNSSRKKCSFLDEIKNIFNGFWRTIIWGKNLKMIKKIVDTGSKLSVSFKLPVFSIQGPLHSNKLTWEVFRKSLQNHMILHWILTATHKHHIISIQYPSHKCLPQKSCLEGLRILTGFDLMTHDSYFTILVEVLTN